MGNTLQDELASDCLEILGEIGHTMAWKGSNYDCIVGDPSIDTSLDPGGFMPQGTILVKMRRAAVAGSGPSINDRVTLNGETYKVSSNVNKENSPFIIIQIEP